MTELTPSRVVTSDVDGPRIRRGCTEQPGDGNRYEVHVESDDGGKTWEARVGGGFNVRLGGSLARVTREIMDGCPQIEHDADRCRIALIVLDLALRRR